MSHLYCPRCSKPLDGHDAKVCGRRLSRRFFFGVCAGAVIAKPALSLMEQYLSMPLRGPQSGIARAGGSLTLEMLQSGLDVLLSARERPAPIIYLPPSHPLIYNHLERG